MAVPRLSRIYGALARWRRRRPFAGGLLLCLGGALVAVLPWAFSQWLIFAAGSFVAVGALFGVLTVLCGLAVLGAPEYASLLGGLGVLLSTLSLLGALGGVLVGTLLGSLGGLLCYAWEPPGEPADAAPVEAEARFSWEGDDAA